MSFRRRFVVVAAALAAIGAAFALLLHAPPVRRAALRYALPVVERQYGLRLDASRLDYNLAALRIGLADVRLAAPHSLDEPFFSAAYVSVTLARSSLLGVLAFDEIAATGARVLVRRRPDGSTNLPSPSGAPDDDPPPLRVNRIDVPQIAVDLRDEQQARFLWIPSLALQLAPDAGFVRLAREAELHTETQLTSVNRLEGDAAFDGRALRVDNLQLELNELDAQLDGSLTLIARDPAVDLMIRGTGDATRLARWVVVNGDLPRGDIAFDAAVAGPLDMLDTRVQVTSDRLAVGSIRTSDLLVRAHIVPDRAEVEELRFGFEGGQVEATAMLPFAPDADGRLAGSWTGISAESATRVFAPDAAVLPSGSVSGRVDAQGRGSDPLAWSAVIGLDVASGTNARGRIALSGDASIELDKGTWRLAGRQVLGGVVPTMFRLGGRLAGGTAADDFTNGAIRVSATELPAVASLLRTTGLAAVPADALEAGTLEGELRLTGRTPDLRVDGRASVRDLRGSQIEVASLAAAVSGRPAERQFDFVVDAPQAVVAGQTVADVRAAGQVAGDVLDLEEISVRQPANTGVLTADGAYSLRTRRYTVAVEGRDWRLIPTAEQPIAGMAALRFAGEGSIDTPRGLGELTLRDVVWDERTLGTIEAAIALEGQTATVKASVPEFAVSADARVGLDAPYAATIDLRAEKLSLERVLEGIGTAVPLSGETTVAAHAELPLEAWRTASATVDVSSLEARAGDLPIRLAEPARLRY
jgi:hypothetical protein